MRLTSRQIILLIRKHRDESFDNYMEATGDEESDYHDAQSDALEDVLNSIMAAEDAL